ncbi:MAG TPA: hypothetical protein VGM60_05285 [Pseudonocardia sp.]|uniref:hypothetical protein n=1 Tax=Pseudonocardia sp. TaxID=60912 RepID=UPI002F412C3D
MVSLQLWAAVPVERVISVIPYVRLPTIDGQQSFSRQPRCWPIKMFLDSRAFERPGPNAAGATLIFRSLVEHVASSNWVELYTLEAEGSELTGGVKRLKIERSDDSLLMRDSPRDEKCWALAPHSTLVRRAEAASQRNSVPVDVWYDAHHEGHTTRVVRVSRWSRPV